MKKKFKNEIIILSILSVLIVNSVWGAEVDEIFFEDSVVVDDTRLSKRGTGLYRYLGVIKAYVGALYVEDGKSTEDVLADTAKRLVLEYFHAIKGEDFGPATNKLIAQNTDAKTLAKLRSRIEEHNALYNDIMPGDRYSLTYVPGKGTELALNGKPIGRIAGADFASALYAMWLGRNPMNSSFKRQLLGYP